MWAGTPPPICRAPQPGEATSNPAQQPHPLCNPTPFWLCSPPYACCAPQPPPHPTPPASPRRVKAVGRGWVELDRPCPYLVDTDWQPQLYSYQSTLQNSGIESLTVQFKFGEWREWRQGGGGVLHPCFPFWSAVQVW